MIFLWIMINVGSFYLGGLAGTWLAFECDSEGNPDNFLYAVIWPLAMAGYIWSRLRGQDPFA